MYQENSVYIYYVQIETTMVKCVGVVGDHVEKGQVIKNLLKNCSQNRTPRAKFSGYTLE